MANIFSRRKGISHRHCATEHGTKGMAANGKREREIRSKVLARAVFAHLFAHCLLIFNAGYYNKPLP